jgi:Acetyltransferase (GNAT) domain
VTSETAESRRLVTPGDLRRALKAVPRAEVGREAWDALADTSDDAWLWHVYDMQDALATWPGATDRSFALVGDDDTPVAVFPLIATEQRRIRGLVPSTTLLSTGGPAVAARFTGKAREEILEAGVGHVREHAAGESAKLDVVLPPTAPSLRGERCPRVNPLLELGFENTLTQTWLLDLRADLDAVWSGTMRTARRKIRKAEAEGIIVRQAREGDLESYYEMHVENYERTGARPHPRAYFERIFSDFVSTGRSLFLLAELDGELVAGRNFGLYKQAGGGWTGASTPRGLEAGANGLLQWRLIEAMIDAGCEWCDLGEAFPEARRSKDAGISFFKGTFGGELYPLYRGRMTIGRRGQVLEAVTTLKKALSR